MSAALEFILGRSGSGKTRRLFEGVAERRGSGEQCFVIVADQATFETERGLADRLGGGLYDCGVYSWQSLARRVLDDCGERRAYLAPQGKLMLTRRAIDLCSSKLGIFKKASAFRGFAAECDGIFKQFKRCAVTPEALKNAAEGMDKTLPLAAKLMDFALIYGECERLMGERYIDSEDMMNALCELLPQSKLAGAHIFIDGGDTMNEQGYRVFRQMLACCKSVTVALGYGAGDRDARLFLPEQRVLERMSDIAAEGGVGFKTTLLPAGAHGKRPALVHIERELFAHPQNIFNEAPQGVSCYIASDRMDEAAEAAENIRRKAAEGMRYRDMAVVVSDLPGYAPIIARVFSAYGIPYFTDVKRSALDHPASELILASLSAVERGFEAQEVLRVLKTGYCDAAQEQIERFENYLLATGISGSRLKEPFDKEAPAGCEEARLAVIGPLLSLKASVQGGSAAQRARAIFDYIETLGVCAKQKALCERLHAEGLLRQEEENAQVLDIIMELLDQLYVILGDGEIGLKRFISVVREGLASYELGAIPTTCDQVLVGNIGRTRARRMRFLQVLGMNDGLFPKKRVDEGIIDDNDLDRMREMGLEVWQSSLALCESDDLDVYSALAKPREELVLSYPISAEGESMAPCALLTSIQRILPKLPVKNGAEVHGLRGSGEGAFKQLAAAVRRMADTGEQEEDAAPLYAYFAQNAKYRSALEAVEDIVFGGSSRASFGKGLAKKLYGSQLYGSASRLETFNRCPFRHYMQYGLVAKEREEHKEKSTDVGSFYHAALEAYTKYVIDNELDWAELDDERIFAILREIMPPLMAGYKGGILFETARQRARLVGMMETIRATCCAVTRQIARGSFRPSGSEVRFGSAEALLPPLRIELEGGMTFFISGIIDRIDTWREQTPEGDAAHSRIIDYKTGGKRFDFAELKAGLQLQLPLYASAVAAGERLRENERFTAAAKELKENLGAFGDTVGMYYMPIKDIAPEETEDGAEKIFREELMADFRLSGLSLNDPAVAEATESFEKRSSVIGARYDKEGLLVGSVVVDRAEYAKVIDDAERIAAQTLARIAAGEARVSPVRKAGEQKSACTYCPYGSVCRFDPDPGSDKYRTLTPLGANGYFKRYRD